MLVCDLIRAFVVFSRITFKSNFDTMFIYFKPIMNRNFNKLLCLIERKRRRTSVFKPRSKTSKAITTLYCSHALLKWRFAGGNSKPNLHIFFITELWIISKWSEIPEINVLYYIVICIMCLVLYCNILLFLLHSIVWNCIVYFYIPIYVSVTCDGCWFWCKPHTSTRDYLEVGWYKVSIVT